MATEAGPSKASLAVDPVELKETLRVANIIRRSSATDIPLHSADSGPEILLSPSDNLVQADNTIRFPQRAQSLPRAESSIATVNDLGNDAQLRQRGPATESALNEATSSGRSSRPPESADTRELTRLATGGSDGHALNSRELQLELSRALKRRHNEEFLPFDELDRIICRTNVIVELCKYFPLWESERREKLATIICDTEERTVEEDSDSCVPKYSSWFTNCRKIFAILVLIGKVRSVAELILEPSMLRDSDLPLSCEYSEDGDIQLRKSSRPEEELDCFTNWEFQDLDSFNKKQWSLHLPFFDMVPGVQKVALYKFPSATIFPWTEEAPQKVSGGYSQVRKVWIPPAHHNFKECKDRGNFFAIKRLHSDSEEDFTREFQALKRFATVDKYPHIVRLLVAYVYRGEYHFILPWADGNLLNLWKKHHPDPETSFGHEKAARWALEQCCGLATALGKIHTYRPSTKDLAKDAPQGNSSPQTDNPPDTEGSSKDTTNQPNPVVSFSSNIPDTSRLAVSHGQHSERPKSQRRGTHGDLKPENILWFSESSGIGTLKISDFGSARWHDEHSMLESPNDGPGLPASPTYKGPEYDVNEEISQSYDMWSLGCIYLEFATWLLRGWPGVHVFSSLRLEEEKALQNLKHKTNSSDYIIADDKFFIMQYDGRERRPEVKQSVNKWIQSLHEDVACTEFVHDLLRLVSNACLRVVPDDRYPTSVLVSHLKSFQKRSEGDSAKAVAYLTQPVPTKPSITPLLGSQSPDLNSMVQATSAVNTQHRQPETADDGAQNDEAPQTGDEQFRAVEEQHDRAPLVNQADPEAAITSTSGDGRLLPRATVFGWLGRWLRIIISWFWKGSRENIGSESDSIRREQDDGAPK